MELFKQNQYSPIPLELQVSTLWAMQNGYFDDVDVENVKDCQLKMEEFLSTRKDEVMAKIRDEKALSDDTVTSLKEAIEDFKKSYK